MAIGALTSTVTLLTQLGRFRQAADREKEIGQIYLQEMRNISGACEAFERAGEWYSQEDANAYVFDSFFHAPLLGLTNGNLAQHCEWMLQGRGGPTRGT